MTINTVPLIEIGLVGVHYQYLTHDGNEASCSGCGYLERFLAEVEKGTYESRAYGGAIRFNGALVIDKRAVLERRPSFAILSPLPNLRSNGEHSRFADVAKDSIVAEAFRHDEGRSGGFGTLVRIADAAQAKGIEPGPLDYVDVQTYARWWRARGARLGRFIQDGAGVAIEWDDQVPIAQDTGTETPVLPELAEQGVNPTIPFCKFCVREGHDVLDCPEMDPEQLAIEREAREEGDA